MPAKALTSGTSRSAALEQAAKYKKQIANIKAKGAEVGQRVMTTAITIGAGAGAGFYAGKYPGKWMNVDKELWIGGVLMGLGLTGLGGDTMSDAALAGGNGVLAAWGYNAAKTKALGA